MLTSHKNKFVWEVGGKEKGRKTKRVDVVAKESNIIQLYRDSHHRIAQMLAMGCTPSFISRHTGISTRRISLLCVDPTFQELIDHYSERAEAKLEDAQEEYVDLMTRNMMRSEHTVSDHFDRAEDEGELIPIQIANRIAMDRADRLGFGKSSSVHVTHDFATLLDQAEARSAKARIINGTPVASVPSPTEAAAPRRLTSPPTLPAPPTPVDVQRPSTMAGERASQLPPADALLEEGGTANAARQSPRPSAGAPLPRRRLAQ